MTKISNSKNFFSKHETKTLIGPAIVYLGLFSVFPLLYSLGISFFEFDRVAGKWNFLGLGNYKEILSDKTFWSAIVVTAVMVGVLVFL